MKWKRQPGSGDIDDRRGEGGGFGRQRLPLPGGARGGGIGSVVVVLILLLVFGRGVFSGDTGFGVPSIEALPPVPGATGTAPAGPDETFEFVKFVARDVQNFWTEQFERGGRSYRRSSVVVFTSGTGSACGPASAATGPFYCPLDERVYLDLGFFDVLARRLGAPGDFAQAYVIAHEIAHHVQNVLGIGPQVRRRQEESPRDANDLSVRLELQADCLAGVWGRSTYTRGLLEPGDMEEGLGAASSVGDDRLGARSPESFTHGTAEQRVRWFRTGFESGDTGGCDTFSGDV